MQKVLRRGIVLGLVAGAVYALWRFVAARVPATDGITFEPQPAPGLPRPVPSVRPPAEHHLEIPHGVNPEGGPETEGEITGIAAWVAPDDGACPVSHPVKAKLASGIFHVPGGQSYERTQADRCYLDTAAAEADGLRRAKR